MASVTCLDTHIVVAAATGKLNTLSRAARRALEKDTLHLSPMVSIELAFLFEIGRISPSPAEFLPKVMEDLGLLWCTADFVAVSKAAQSLTWTRDPFDRVIVAHAQAEGAAIVTKDETILTNFSNAIW